jgi:hypothetical protein
VNTLAAQVRAAHLRHVASLTDRDLRHRPDPNERELTPGERQRMTGGAQHYSQPAPGSMFDNTGMTLVLGDLP